MHKPKIIEIFYITAGGGHFSTMNALKSELSKRYPYPLWEIRPINLREVLDPIDLIHAGTKTLKVLRDNLKSASPRLRRALDQEKFGSLAMTLAFRERHAEDIYNDMLKAGKTDGLKFLLFMLQSYIKLRFRRIEKLLHEHWQKAGNKPDMVISVVPNFNGIMFRALKKIYPAVPYVTVMTDLVDIAKHFWIERQAQFLICGTEEARRQALKVGYKDQKNVFKTSGMILKPDFYRSAKTTMPLPAGLARHKTTALIMFGGYGSVIIKDIVDQLNKSDLGIQYIVMCGNNKELLAQLQGQPNCHAVGFVNNVVDYMDLADFMIGKPGPGCLEEARTRGLPVIVLNDRTTMLQERPNVRIIEKHDIGFGVAGFDTIADDVRRMIDNLDRYRANIKKMQPNNALAEAADILGKVINRTFSHANLNVPAKGTRKLSLRLAVKIRKRLRVKIAS